MEGVSLRAAKRASEKLASLSDFAQCIVWRLSHRPDCLAGMGAVRVVLLFELMLLVGCEDRPDPAAAAAQARARQDAAPSLGAEAVLVERKEVTQGAQSPNN